MKINHNSLSKFEIKISYLINKLFFKSIFKYKVLDSFANIKTFNEIEEVLNNIVFKYAFIINFCKQVS